jgi:hypothetical protein
MCSVASLTFFVFGEEAIHNKEALDKTMSLLKNRAERESFMQDNPDAKKTDLMVKDLVGEGADLEKVYQLSAEILRGLSSENGGDVNSMLKTIQEAQGNPEAFYKSLSPEHRQLIKELGSSASKNKKPVPPRN